MSDTATHQPDRVTQTTGDKSSAFGAPAPTGPDRSAGLRRDRDRTPPAPAPPPVPVVADVAQEERTEPAAEAEPSPLVPSPTAPAAQAETVPAADTSSARRTSTRTAPTRKRKPQRRHPLTPARLPADLRDRLRTTAATTGRDYAAVLRDALEAHHTELDRLFPPPTAPAAAPGRLFAPRPEPLPAAEPGVQVNFTLLPTERAVLDELVTAHPGVGSLNRLITGILDRYLPA